MDTGLPALATGSSSPTDSVKVLCELHGHVIIDDGLYAFDIQPSGGQVRGHQKVDRAVSEELQGTETLWDQKNQISISSVRRGGGGGPLANGKMRSQLALCGGDDAPALG